MNNYKPYPPQQQHPNIPSDNIYNMANSYPKKKQTTSIDKVMIPTSNKQMLTGTPVTPPSPVRKILISILITLIAAFIFSSYLFTQTDKIFTSFFGLNFFDTDGHPMYPIIAFHSVVFFCVIIFILKFYC